MTADEFDEYARKLGARGSAAPAAADPFDVYAQKLGAGESVASDVAKSVAMAPPKAALGIAGMPGTLREVGDMLQRKASEYAPDWLKKATAAGNVVSRFADPIAAMLPSAHKMQTAAEGVTGDWYQPKTWQGKAADTGVQTALTMGRNWITNPAMTGAMTAAVTGGTEAARHLSDENPWWMMAGGLLGGLPVAARNALKTRQGVVVRDALGDLPESDLAAGIVAQERARAQGVPLMGTESLDRGHSLASAVRASPTGNPIIDPFVAKRPQQVSAAVMRDILGPTQSKATPQEAAVRGEKAATGRIKMETDARSRAVQPYYDAAEFESIPPQALRPVANEIQNHIFGSTIGSPEERALQSWHKQLFPNEIPQVAFPPEPKSIGPTRVRRPPEFDGATDDLMTLIRKKGGITPTDEAVGSLAKKFPFEPHPQFGPVWAKRTGQSNSETGHSLDVMSQLAEQYGFTNIKSPNDLMDAIEAAHRGIPTYAAGRDLSNFGGSNDPLQNLNETLLTFTRQQAARKQPRGLPGETVDLPGAALPETNVGRLQKLKRNMAIEADTPEIGATSQQKIDAYPAREVGGVLNDVLKANNANLSAADQLYQHLTKTRVEPLTSGPVGVVAGRTGFDPAAPSAWPRVSSVVSNADNFKAKDVSRLAAELSQVDKQAFPDIAHAWINNELDNAVSAIRSGPNPTAGAKFFEAMAGSPDQAAKFDATMRAVALSTGHDPDSVVRGARNLLKTLDLTGRTPGLGSPTQPRGEIAKELGKSVTGDAMAAMSSSPMRPLAQRLNDMMMRGRYEDIARALTAPDSVQILAKMAKLKPNGLTASYYAAALLGLDRVNGSGQ